VYFQEPRRCKKAARTKVLIGSVTVVLVMVVLFTFVREQRKPKPSAGGTRIGLAVIREPLDTKLKVFLAIIAIFTLGCSSDFFVIF
jgi:hypothetical protein